MNKITPQGIADFVQRMRRRKAQNATHKLELVSLEMTMPAPVVLAFTDTESDGFVGLMIRTGATDPENKNQWSPAVQLTEAQARELFGWLALRLHHVGD